MRIFFTESTRTTASKWMVENIPENSILLTEHWDDGLPVGLKNVDIPKYEYIVMENFNDDTDVKLGRMALALEEGDYLLITSRRLSGTISRAEDKYPYTSQYYSKLFTGYLGYKEVKSFQSYPGLGFIEISTESAEETFEVFDHPTIYIFENVERLDADILYDKLTR